MTRTRDDRAAGGQWLLTAVFAAAGLRAALSRREPAGRRSRRTGSRLSFCGAMCAALIAMTWRSEPAAATWLQAALFGCAAFWSGLASLVGFGRVRRPSLPALLHTLMAGAMIWLSPRCLPLPGCRRRVGPRRDGAHVPGRHARPGARHQHPARGVLRSRVHPVAGAGHRLWTSGERPGLGQPGRDERRDGSDAVRDTVTTSLEQTGLVEEVIRGYLFRLEPAVAVEDGSGSPPAERGAVASGGRDR